MLDSGGGDAEQSTASEAVKRPSSADRLWRTALQCIRGDETAPHPNAWKRAGQRGRGR
jgi:hypothetical protein